MITRIEGTVGSHATVYRDAHPDRRCYTGMVPGHSHHCQRSCATIAFGAKRRLRCHKPTHPRNHHRPPATVVDVHWWEISADFGTQEGSVGAWPDESSTRRG